MAPPLRAAGLLGTLTRLCMPLMCMCLQHLACTNIVCAIRVLEMASKVNTALDAALQVNEATRIIEAHLTLATAALWQMLNTAPCSAI